MSDELGWFLPASAINEMQCHSLEDTISAAKRAHYTNVKMRINGQWREFEADWIKHLRMVGKP